VQLLLHIKLIFLENLVLTRGLMEKHWTEKLFIENASLYGVALEERIEKASVDVLGLIKIFSEFQISRGSLVLDLACGIGRHSVALAESGFRVVGVDLSPAYITRARELAAERGVGDKCDFRIGDMRRINEVLKGYEGKFKAVLSLFTSMGYYDEETDKQILMQLKALTAPKGVLIIDVSNRDWIIRHFQARDFNQFGDGLVMIVERKFNLENSRMENIWRFYMKQEEGLKHLSTIEIDHRVYSLHELKKQVEESGWTYQTCYGNLNLQPFTMDSRRMLLVATKKGSNIASSGASPAS